MDLTVRVDTKPFELALRDVAKQVPFAVSYAMNQTAKQTIPILRQDILHVFTVRNNWEAMGITFNAATKRDLTVEIGSRHDYMAAQVTGGVKKDKDGGHIHAAGTIAAGGDVDAGTGATVTLDGATGDIDADGTLTVGDMAGVPIAHAAANAAYDAGVNWDAWAVEFDYVLIERP